MTRLLWTWEEEIGLTDLTKTNNVGTLSSSSEDVCPQKGSMLVQILHSLKRTIL